MDIRAFAPVDVGAAYSRGLQIQDQREDRQNKKRLADLIPRAAHGDQEAIDQLYSVDPRIAEHLDDRQREQAKAEVADLTAAVRWADNPEKWQQVQQHFGQRGVDLSPYGFEDRERGMLALGKLGEYLNSAPKSEYKSIEAGGSLIDVSGGQPRVVIAPNEGGHPTGAPVGGGIPQGAAEMLRSNPNLAPQFDQKYGPGASQKVLGGQMGSGPSAGFSGY